MISHLNSTGCEIKVTPGKGRGVFASRQIPSQTLIEISPVLLFEKSEYQEHGKYTILDHYTFNWRDGRYALALGLGSIFNHSQTPNVTYTLDRKTDSIRYTTSRVIKPDEELCIFYGHKLWFDPVDAMDKPASPIEDEKDDGWGGLTNIDDGNSDGDESASEIIPEDQLPFDIMKLVEEDMEEDINSIHTMDAWVVDILDLKSTSTTIQWMKKAGLEHPALDHLKRVRKLGSKTTVLLTSTELHPNGLDLPPDIDLGSPYIVTVPSRPALSMMSLQVKSTLWPVLLTPPRKVEAEIWTRGKVKWAHSIMQFLLEEAAKAQESSELPIVSCVPAPYEEGNHVEIKHIAHDTRNSTLHPLRHSILNLTRKVGEAHEKAADTEHNGSNYLLTSQVVFTTHEPCIMCSMALLHSRVARVAYLIPMEKTGGCSGVTCLPKLESVNHRFGILKWRQEIHGHKMFHVDNFIDA